MVGPDMGVIQVAWGVFLVTWLVLAFRTKRTVARPQRLGRFVVVFVIDAVALTVGRVAGVNWYRRAWIVHSTMSVTATTLVVLGLAFTVWARLTIGTNWSGTVALKENHELIVKGPYRLVRHPIYSGLLAMGVGTVLIYAEPIGLLWFFAAAAVFVMRIPAEEKLMTETFPDQYPEYRRRVKAIIPFVL
jgi:protein-S-isoprenylcysteine O-methyltransferase Ste14